MEVGAVKQAFNNELILLKKNLNQARTQVIHKLTRKAKTLTEKKAPDALKEKLKRKAESAVNEVLIIKKIKVKDLAQFMVTHQGELKDYLNRPNVDQNKACARLLLHKALQEKYKHIRGRFAKVPIRDLFMSRQERLKLKKEAKEKQKSKKKGKNNKIVNAEGDWEVEDTKMGSVELLRNNNHNENDDEAEIMSSDGENNFDVGESSADDQSNSKVLADDADSAHEQSNDDDISEENDGSEGDDGSEDGNDNNVVHNKLRFGNLVKLIPDNRSTTTQVKDKSKVNTDIDNKNIIKPRQISPLVKKVEKKKDANKNKNLNEKLLQRKFKKTEDDVQATQNKVVDPFFITASGENYMSVAEPRQPDEVKEIHKQGNRKLRRAAMFGHVPKINTKEKFDDSRFKQNDDRDNFRSKFNDRDRKSNDKASFKDRKQFDKNMNFNSTNDAKPEKLHPSWEAKKKQSGILPFQGKKIVFDEN